MEHRPFFCRFARDAAGKRRGDRSGGQEIAIRSILDFYQQNHVISVSGGAFGANLGASLWSNDKGKKGIEQDEEGLRTIRKVIKRLAEFKQ